MKQPKKIPVRLCLGCNSPKEKREMVRIVKNKDGEIRVDLTGKLPGRGAYICKDPECLAKLEKNRRLGRALNADIPAEVFGKLREELTSASE